MSSGISRLKDYIFIVCPKEYIGSIRVFDDAPPFDLLMLMSLDEIIEPWEFIPSLASECLYVTDLNSSCIWKITIEDLQLTKWLCNLKRPMGVTISTDDQVMIVQHDQTSDTRFLEIYGSDAGFIRRIYLSNDFYRPDEAFLKPDGQFITVYRDGYNNLVISLATTDGQLISQVSATCIGSNSSSDELCWSFRSNDVEVNDFEYKSECIATLHLFTILMLRDFSSSAISIWSRNGYGKNEIFLM